jgi:hypothetical protein
MPVNEASVEETPYGRYVTSAGWFVNNLPNALALRNEEKGGATYPIGSRPEIETLNYPVSEVAAKYGASVAKETGNGDVAYADWPGEYLPTRLEWPIHSGA